MKKLLSLAVVVTSIVVGSVASFAGIAPVVQAGGGCGSGYGYGYGDGAGSGYGYGYGYGYGSGSCANYQEMQNVFSGNTGCTVAVKMDKKTCEKAVTGCWVSNGDIGFKFDKNCLKIRDCKTKEAKEINLGKCECEINGKKISFTDIKNIKIDCDINICVNIKNIKECIKVCNKEEVKPAEEVKVNDKEILKCSRGKEKECVKESPKASASVSPSPASSTKASVSVSTSAEQVAKSDSNNLPKTGQTDSVSLPMIVGIVAVLAGVVLVVLRKVKFGARR